MSRKEVSEFRKNFRKRRAELWGISLMEMEKESLEICEVLEYNWSNKISLVEFRGLWTFSLHVWPGDIGGQFYGALFSFCDPYPDRLTALEHAVSHMLAVYKRSKRSEVKKLIKWANSLITPQQLRLI